MGGSYYDREVSTTNYTSVGSGGETTTVTRLFSEQAERLRQATALDPKMDPKGRNVSSDSASPIVICLDVTGSMGDWPLIIWDKMPMFYGQIMMQGYLEDPHICFCACGDAYGDRAPLQVADFATGMSLDEWLNRLYIEGGGGGAAGSRSACETYELAAYYFAFHCKLTNKKKPLFFFLADESFNPEIEAKVVQNLIGDTWNTPKIPSEKAFAALRQNFNVFLLRKSYSGRDPEIQSKWKGVLGDGRIMTLKEPKAIVDAMLGVICLTSGARDLDGYCRDMQERGQDEGRIAEVRAALQGINPKLEDLEAHPSPDLGDYAKSDSCLLS